MKKKINLLEDILNKMFEIAGHQVTYNDIKDRKDNWYQQYTMTETQRKDWMEWSKEYLKKKKKWNKKMCTTEMAMVDLCYGLKTVD